VSIAESSGEKASVKAGNLPTASSHSFGMGESDDFLQAWLAQQCSIIAGTVSGVLLLGEPDTGPYEPVSLWPLGQPVSQHLAEAANRTLQSRQSQTLEGSTLAVVTCPLLLDGQMHGLVAVEMSSHQKTALSAAIQSLQWGLLGVEARLRSQQSLEEQNTRERLIATLDLVASVLVEDGFESSAQALATDLATRLDCDRVSIGFVRDQHTNVVAVSHSAEFGKRMNLIRAIGTAMDESLDQKSIIVLPSIDGGTLVTRDHASLARLFGSDSVLTIPFSVGQSITGAVTFERPRGKAFSPNEIELCQAVVALSSRILDAKRLNDRWLLTRITDSIREELAKLIGSRHFSRKLVALLVTAIVLFFSFAVGEYRVGANAALEGSVRRVLVAPYDGFIAGASKRAGDVVTAGTVLASLDESDLRLEYHKWTSQRAQYVRQYQEASAKHDRAQSNIILSQVQQAEAQINLLAEQLKRTKVTAPFDGLVVSGDLSQQLGSSVTRGQILFEVSPLNSYRVVLEVDEGEITSIRVGQTGNLLLTSLPGEVFPLVVTSITPVTLSKDGRSFFRVEALLERLTDRLRPGMEGVAKIEVGERKLIWIWTHKMHDWLRLALWSWL